VEVESSSPTKTATTGKSPKREGKESEVIVIDDAHPPKKRVRTAEKNETNSSQKKHNEVIVIE
jgi:hypothetical protein